MKILIGVILVAAGVLWAIRLVDSPSLWAIRAELFSTHKDVLGVKLPDGIVCRDEMLSTSGHEQSYFAYFAVFTGSDKDLADFVTTFGLKPARIDHDQLAIDMQMSLKPRDWWTPPSRSETAAEYDIYYMHSEDNDHPYRIVRAELTMGSLYWAQYGAITTLHASYKDNHRRR